jgi:hypothetical protein
MREVLVLPFELRGYSGAVHVCLGINEDPCRWGYQFLGLDYGEEFEGALGFPVIEASVQFGAEGYAAELGWIQTVTQSTPHAPDVPMLCDVPPHMRSVAMPFMSFGVRPTLFDAPAYDTQPNLRWRATAFLTYTPDLLLSKVIGKVCGFSWGFDKKHGEITSRPVSEAGQHEWEDFASSLRPLYSEWTFLSGEAPA